VQTHEIRKRFLDHYVKAGHTEVPSASVILDDPNLLFVNAGMVQFVPFFLGQQTPPWDRAVSVQKCVRTPDIDEVGITTRHNTFFQMAGNFSFGDYFKKGAIEFAWTLLTNPQDQGGYGFKPERLWATVYLDDDEAISLWQEVAGLPAERIQRRGMADNYWSMGIPGPCGPSSEIYYDRGPEYGIEGGPEANEDRYIEIWNLVFMQNERGQGTSKSDFEILGPLPRKNIDTGMGVERVACLLQGVDNVYETDLLRPVIDYVSAIAPRPYVNHGHSADDGTPEAGGATNHQHREGDERQVEIDRVDVDRDEVDVEAARETGQEPGERERREALTVDRDADRARRRGIFPCSAKLPPEPASLIREGRNDDQHGADGRLHEIRGLGHRGERVQARADFLVVAKDIVRDPEHSERGNACGQARQSH